MLPLRFIDRVKFFIERQFVKGAGFQLLVVIAVIGLISLLGGLLVAPTGDDFASLGEAVWWAFLRLTDPGYLGDDEGNWQRFISTLLTVSGYVVFLGALVAIMTRWLITMMTNLERGLTPVAHKHHVVVLGWNNRTLPLLSELLSSTGRMRRFLERNDTRRLRLVVLSDHAGAEQLLILKNEPSIGHRIADIVLRAGTPIQPEALHRVACLDAAAIIVPSSSHSPDSLVSSDVETVKALLSIAAEARLHQRNLPYAVVELQDIRKQAVVSRAYPGEVEVLAGDATISRLLVQNILHPGLSAVFQELLSGQQGNQLYVRSSGAQVGQTLAEVASHCPRAIILGVLASENDSWQIQLNAPSQRLLTEQDLLVLLAQDYADTEPQPKLPALPAVTRQTITPVEDSHRGSQRRILLLGWNRRAPSLIAELASYEQQHIQLDLVSIVPGTERHQAIHGYMDSTGNVAVQHIETDYMIEGALRRLQPKDYDTIILISSDRLASEEEADARAMVGFLQLQDILADEPRRPQIIIELSDPANESLLHTRHSETLISPVILSHMLAQVALRRELRMVYDELFTQGGAEILFRPASDYPLAADARFHDLEQAAADQGQTALGIYRQQGESQQQRLILNPPRDRPVALNDGDQVVILGLTES